MEHQRGQGLICQMKPPDRTQIDICDHITVDYKKTVCSHDIPDIGDSPAGIQNQRLINFLNIHIRFNIEMTQKIGDLMGQMVCVDQNPSASALD